MNNLEKLITNLSNYWDISPDKVVDRLNFMNEQEINKIVDKMTKKFQSGGYLSRPPIGNRMIISKATTYKPRTVISDEQIDSAIRAENKAKAEQFKREAAGLQSRLFQTQTELAKRRATPVMKTQPDAPITNSDPQYFNGSRNVKFANGGMIDCLSNGGEFSKCMKCGGNMVRKGAIGMNTEVPPTGTASAYIGTYPEFNPSDSTWTQKDGRYIKNAFSGNDLYQNIVTYGEYGTPRRSVRIIKNFRTPDADTSRVDGFGKIASDNPGLIERIFGTPFTKQFKGAQDKILEGMDPKYSSEKEVRSSQKKANGGELKKKMSTPPKKKQNLLKTKK